MSGDGTVMNEQIAALLSFNNVSVSEAFQWFDLDQDGRLSVADLLGACEEFNLASTEKQATAWIASNALVCHQEDQTFLTFESWCTTLKYADGSRVLQVTRNVSEHEQQQIQQDPADDKELIRQLQDAQKLLESSKVQGSLHMGDDSSSTVSSSVSSPPESAGSGDSFEDPESRQKMLEKHDAAVRIQARSRGMQDRKIVAEMKETRRREPISQAPRDLDEASYDDEFEDEDEDEAALEGELAGLRAQMKADASAGAELAFDSEEDLRLAADRGEAEDSEEDAYDDEFENDDQETRTPRWVGSETVETEKEAKDSKEQGKVGGDAQVQAAVKDTGSDVLSMQIGIIQAEWAGATRHEKIRKFATERLAHSIVLDLVDAVVECQEALATKRERDRVRQELEDNRGYRKPRIVEAITEHIKRAHAEELRMKEQLFIESNRWFRERGARLRALKRAEADSDLKQKQKTAEYVQMRRAKVDQIYEAREQEKALNKMKVNDLKAQRLRESQELRLFVKRCKQQEEARAEEELKGGLVNDAKQRRQALLAQTLKDKMIAEKQMMHELGVKAARRRVLKEEKKEREFQKFAQVLGARKTKRNKQRQVKRESMMKLYESSLQAAEEMRNKKHSADLSSSKGAVMGGAKDPNEALKFAIGAYFSDPGAGFMESKTRKLMGNLMFQQAAGTEWTEKRIEGRLREIFTWIDKDATGQVEAKELHGALQRMGGKVSFAEVDVLLKGVDVDGDGQLTLDEFITFGKALFEQHTDVSGSKVLASPKRPGTSRLRTATPEMVHANKVERDERRKAARRVKQAEQEAKESRVQQNKARAAERRKFVHQAVTAYTKAMEDNLKDKDKEMEVMVNKVEIARRRKQQWFDRQWDEMLLVEEQYSRLLDLKRAESYANKESIWRQEQKRIAVAKRFRDTAEYEKAITAEFLISTVDGKRRMASPGFPVAVAPRKTATPVMREISSVYLARPRTSASSSYSRPYTSMGLMMGDGLLDEAIENTPDRQASSYGGVSSSVSSGTVPQSRFVLTENEKKAALDYFIRFGSKTSLGEKQMPYNRFFRMLVTMKFVPTQITESEAMQIYCAAIEKEGFEHAKESNLTQKQFLRAIFHVSEWTGRSFFEMALDWSMELRSSCMEHPLLSKTFGSRSSDSLTSLAQRSLPALQGFLSQPSTPLFGVRAPTTKKDYLKLRKHMKIASYHSVKASGPIAAEFLSENDDTDLEKGSKTPHHEWMHAQDAGQYDSLPSISPSEVTSPSSFEASISTVGQKSPEKSIQQEFARRELLSEILHVDADSSLGYEVSQANLRESELGPAGNQNAVVEERGRGSKPFAFKQRR